MLFLFTIDTKLHIEIELPRIARATSSTNDLFQRNMWEKSCTRINYFEMIYIECFIFRVPLRNEMKIIGLRLIALVSATKRN